MMRRRVVIPSLVLASLGAVPTVAVAQFSDPRPPAAGTIVADPSSQRFSAAQLDNLAGPVALYPDALLAQVLVAATFPDQVQDAADFVRANGTDSIDVQNWDVSVKAVAHYPSALNAMADKIDWTSALGKAYATQSSDVMSSVQRLRRMAADQGNLKSTPQQNIVTNSETVQIVPVEPRVIYVPVYDPYVIYTRPIFNIGLSSRYWSFGVGFPIGSWLIYDCDWGMRRVYYNGWSPSYYAFGGGWRQRSRPFIQITNIYVSPRYTNVYYNRTVINRSINYYNVDRYAGVHSGRQFDGRRDGRYDSRDDGRNGTRYAVRNDGNNRAGAVPGGGYRQGDQGSNRNGNSGYGNNGYGNNGSQRDGSGYGGDGNRGDGNRDGGYRDGGNRDGGNRDGGNRDGGNRDGGNRDGNGGRPNGNDGTARDGNGNRVGNPNARPPEQRRSEPVYRSGGSEIVIPERRRGNEQMQQPQAQPSEQRDVQRSPRVISPQRSTERSNSRISAPQERQAQPQSAPSERRSEPSIRVEPQRSAPSQQSGQSSGDGRTAKRRGGD